MRGSGASRCGLGSLLCSVLLYSPSIARSRRGRARGRLVGLRLQDRLVLVLLLGHRCDDLGGGVGERRSARRERGTAGHRERVWPIGATESCHLHQELAAVIVVGVEFESRLKAAAVILTSGVWEGTGAAVAFEQAQAGVEGCPVARLDAAEPIGRVAHTLERELVKDCGGVGT